MQRKTGIWGVMVVGLFLGGCDSASFEAFTSGDKDKSDVAFQDDTDSPGTTDASTSADDDGSSSADNMAEDDGATGDDDSIILAETVIDDEPDEESDAATTGDADDGEEQPEPTRVIVKFRKSVPAGQRAALHKMNGFALDRVITQLDAHIVRIPPGKTVDDVIAKYERHPLIEFVEVETFAEPQLTPNDIWYPNGQLQLQSLGAEAAWDITTGSPDVPIAVLDTGLDTNHPEFVDRIARGEIFGHDFKDSDADYYDPFGHGTAVSGIIAAQANNNIGIAGGSWNNPLAVLRTGFGLDIIEAITWATDNGVRVISMSFGSGSDMGWQRDAMQYAFDRGVVLVAAGGNSCQSNPFYPAFYPTVLAVTGVDFDGMPVGYACGDWIDLSGPAGALTTFWNNTGNRDNNDLGNAGGTSISTPFVAAAAGLVLSVNPDLTPTQVMDILRNTADDVYTPGFDVKTGHGRVNYYAAVLAAQGTAPPTPDTAPPTVTITAPTDGALATGTVTLSVTASDNVGVSRVDLYCNDVFVSSDSVSPHDWSVDTTTMPDGAHVFKSVAFDATGNSAESDPITVMVDNAECAVAADCDDADACTTDNCIGGQCTNTTVSCDDGDAKTVDSCDSSIGCVNTPMDCDDGDACTVDAFDASFGCSHTAIDCNDNNACTMDTCDSLAGCANQLISCDDGNAATVDRCDASLGCINTPVDCDDGNACTMDTIDGNGLCTHTALNCNDDNACTTDTCDPAIGCVVNSISCDDGDACTTDACDSATGCSSTTVNCPSGQTCLDGACQSTVCNANGVCESGEDCQNCPSDCVAGQGSICGNGICEAGNGEDCATCPTDCNGKQSGSPSGRFCCGGGGGESPVGCGDTRCNSTGYYCITSVVPDSCCGDGICEGTESGCDCPIDCGAPDATENKGATCRDGIDNDCDGVADCYDADCEGESSCPTCLPTGSPCAGDADCCTQKCRGGGKLGPVCK